MATNHTLLNIEAFVHEKNLNERRRLDKSQFILYFVTKYIVKNAENKFKSMQCICLHRNTQGNM